MKLGKNITFIKYSELRYIQELQFQPFRKKIWLKEKLPVYSSLKILIFQLILFFKYSKAISHIIFLPNYNSLAKIWWVLEVVNDGWTLIL